MDDQGWIDPWSSCGSLDTSPPLQLPSSLVRAPSFPFAHFPSAPSVFTTLSLARLVSFVSERRTSPRPSIHIYTYVGMSVRSTRRGRVLRFVLHQPVTTGPPTSLQPPEENDNDSADATTATTAFLSTTTATRRNFPFGCALK